MEENNYNQSLSRLSNDVKGIIASINDRVYKLRDYILENCDPPSFKEVETEAEEFNSRLQALKEGFKNAYIIATNNVKLAQENKEKESDLRELRLESFVEIERLVSVMKILTDKEIDDIHEVIIEICPPVNDSTNEILIKVNDTTATDIISESTSSLDIYNSELALQTLECGDSLME